MKVLSKVLIVITIFCCFGSLNMSYAGTISDIMGGAKNFTNTGQNGEIVNETNLKNTSNLIYNLLLAIAIITAVAVGSILGIKFMAASVEQKAEIKEVLLPYVAGCIVVFGAFGIWKIAVNVFKAF